MNWDGICLPLLRFFLGRRKILRLYRADASIDLI